MDGVGLTLKTMWRYRNAAHYLLGMLAVEGSLVHWTIPLVLTSLFLVYEVNEDWHIKDRAYHDVLECLIGAALAAARLILWRYLL